MKTHRILGILWLALCCNSVINLLRALMELHPTASGLWVAWFVFAGSCLLYVAGMVASIFLFRGARWARWLIALVAIQMVVFGPIASIVIQKSLPIWAAFSGVFALVSLVLLFLPRHEPVA
jgi:drug/metabolite transporter superfamily protein YnfA